MIVGRNKVEPPSVNASAAVGESDEVLRRLAPAHRDVLAAHLQAELAFDMGATLQTLTRDCRFEDVAEGTVYSGRGGAGEYYSRWWTAFRVQPSGGRLYVSDPATLIAETRFVGRHVGTWDGIEPTGRIIDLPMMIVVTFAEGLMAGERFYYDRTTLLRQLTGGR